MTHKLRRRYIETCHKFAEIDKSLQSNYHIHHIVPRCLGGTDDADNLIKVSIEHHKVLHNLILQSYRPKQKNNTITKQQYLKLLYAANKMNGKRYSPYK